MRTLHIHSCCNTEAAKAGVCNQHAQAHLQMQPRPARPVWTAKEHLLPLLMTVRAWPCTSVLAVCTNADSGRDGGRVQLSSHKYLACALKHSPVLQPSIGSAIQAGECAGWLRWPCRAWCQTGLLALGAPQACVCVSCCSADVCMALNIRLQKASGELCACCSACCTVFGCSPAC